MLVRIKNRSPHPVLLKSVLGDTIQINAGVAREVSDDFLVDYDRTQIQILTRNSIKTEVSTPIEEVAVEAVTTSKSTRISKSSKNSTPTNN